MLAQESNALLDVYSALGREPAPHLKTALACLSREHVSGIAIAQLDSPMMRQFRASKEEVPDALLFFRMGDFFELFGLDAIIAADVCGLTLTSRDKSSDSPVPMAGVPAVAHRAALRKCVQAGFKVAVCDQVEDPRAAKGLVRREILRVATPAVPGDLGEDDDNVIEGCYLACAIGKADRWTLAFVDVSTGEFRVCGGVPRESLEQELLTVRPREILCAPDCVAEFSTFARGRFSLVPRVGAIEPWIQRSEKDARALFEEFFPAHAFNRFGLSAVEHGLPVVAGVLAYLKNTQKNVLRNLRTVSVYEKSDHLLLDESTKKHLDFFATATGDRKGSLFWFLNRCATAAGSRALVRRMNYPFKHAADVETHLACVEEISATPWLEERLGTLLQGVGDIDRLLARAAQGGIDPKGLAWLRQTLAALTPIQAALEEAGSVSLLRRLSAFDSARSQADELFCYLTATLEDEPAVVLGKGRVFRTGFSPELDEVVALETDFDALIQALERTERDKTGIATLRIGYTRVFGYYFEISKGKLSQVPAHFLRKQTLTNGERFVTQELKELEEKALVATERRSILERELFETVRGRVLTYADALCAASRYLAEVDLVRTFALIAAKEEWCKPRVADTGETSLTQCVHPVLASLAGAEPFVANDVNVGGRHGHVLLITGPNMAGKSTLMRQAALAQVLFQMGSYVPAREASIGLCDRLFTRIGSGDFALRNQSTFMVEMLETAQILRHATGESFVLMDEIGRGTSTFDGLSLAWAILEDLHDRVKARTLFSTHYHEILSVAQGRAGVVPMQMEVLESRRAGTSVDGPKMHGWDISFSRRFKAGAAGKSYGLHVAEMAGLSDGLVARAACVLGELSHPAHDVAPQVSPPASEKQSVPTAQVPPALSPEKSTPQEAALAAALAHLDPDALTPREALSLVYELRSMAMNKVDADSDFAEAVQERLLEQKKRLRKSEEQQALTLASSPSSSPASRRRRNPQGDGTNNDTLFGAHLPFR